MLLGQWAAAADAESPEAARLTDVARLLAGIEIAPTSPLGALAKRQAVVEHRAAFDQSWSRFSKQRLAPAAQFVAQQIGSQPPMRGPVFYPFSGPDMLYALALFPAASRFALTGLEPVGGVPDLQRFDDRQLAASLSHVRRSLNSILAWSFFRTNDMKEDLKAEARHSGVSGVTPVLMVFLARHGAQIRAVDAVVLTPDRGLQPAAASALAQPQPAGHIPGVRIAFRLEHDTDDRLVHYFAADVGDRGLAAAPHYLKWVEAHGADVTFVKSASYLMHKSYFATVRSFILAHARLVVQDDSGIPIRHFAGADWEHRLFGTYVGPIPMFQTWYQKDMKAAYDRASTTISFGIGYQHVASRSNLQAFVRRDPQPRS